MSLWRCLVSALNVSRHLPLHLQSVVHTYRQQRKGPGPPVPSAPWILWQRMRCTAPKPDLFEGNPSFFGSPGAPLPVVNVPLLPLHCVQAEVLKDVWTTWEQSNRLFRRTSPSSKLNITFKLTGHSLKSSCSFPICCIKCCRLCFKRCSYPLWRSPF